MSIEGPHRGTSYDAANFKAECEKLFAQEKACDDCAGLRYLSGEKPAMPICLKHKRLRARLAGVPLWLA